MKVSIGTDHAGLEIKNDIADYLRGQGYEVVDLGTYDKTSCDYTDYAEKVGVSVMRGEVDRGILVCMTGIGMSVAVNKIPSVRGALVRDLETARLTREHNDSNVLILSGKFTPLDEAKQICDIWLSTEFSNEERHARRIDKISALEGKY